MPPHLLSTGSLIATRRSSTTPASTAAARPSAGSPTTPTHAPSCDGPAAEREGQRQGGCTGARNDAAALHGRLRHERREHGQQRQRALACCGAAACPRHQASARQVGQVRGVHDAGRHALTVSNARSVRQLPRQLLREVAGRRGEPRGTQRHGVVQVAHRRAAHHQWHVGQRRPQRGGQLRRTGRSLGRADRDTDGHQPGHVRSRHVLRSAHERLDGQVRTDVGDLPPVAAQQIREHGHGQRVPLPRRRADAAPCHAIDHDGRTADRAGRCSRWAMPVARCSTATSSSPVGPAGADAAHGRGDDVEVDLVELGTGGERSFHHTPCATGVAGHEPGLQSGGPRRTALRTTGLRSRCDGAGTERRQVGRSHLPCATDLGGGQQTEPHVAVRRHVVHAEHFGRLMQGEVCVAHFVHRTVTVGALRNQADRIRDRSVVGLPLRQRGTAALDEHGGHTTRGTRPRPGWRPRRPARAAASAGASGATSSNARRLHARLPVLVQVAHHVVQAVGSVPLGEIHRDDVAEHVHPGDLPGGQQPAGQRGGRARPDGVGRRA